MPAIIINSESSANLKLLSELARKLGEKVSLLTEAQTEDLALGILMEQEKTGKSASRDAVMKKLNA